MRTGTFRQELLEGAARQPDAVLDPARPMLGPVADGGWIVANTAPGCWGPMITPELRGGHEVTKPVAVAGAEVGDAIVIRIQSIEVTSLATASGTENTKPAKTARSTIRRGKNLDTEAGNISWTRLLRRL